MENRSNFKQLLARKRNQPKRLVKYGLYLATWANEYLKKTTATGYVLGVSGGIDSALALAILSSISGIKVIGAFIDIESSKQDLEDAKLLQEKYKFNFVYIDMNDIYHSMVKKLEIENNDSAKANLKVRLRSNVLYALASKHNVLTCGTTNAAEWLVGYYTKFGDNTCDIALLSYLNKEQIRYLANYFSVPVSIINKQPSAGLYEGQTDEKDMGISYKEIDHYLSYAVIDPLAETKINTRYLNNRHKLEAPARPKKFMSFRNIK